MPLALNRLKGTGKRKAGSDDHPLFINIPVAVSKDELKRSLGARAVRTLQAQGVTTTLVRISTVMLGSFLHAQERVTRPASSWSATGIANGRLVSSDKILSKYHDDASRKTKQERLKKQRADARAAKRATREKSSEQSLQGAGSEVGRGGRGCGRGGGRGTLATASGGREEAPSSAADGRQGGADATSARPR